MGNGNQVSSTPAPYRATEQTLKNCVVQAYVSIRLDGTWAIAKKVANREYFEEVQFSWMLKFGYNSW
jgi:hypothetical protein